MHHWLSLVKTFKIRQTSWTPVAKELQTKLEVPETLARSVLVGMTPCRLRSDVLPGSVSRPRWDPVEDDSSVISRVSVGVTQVFLLQ
jgi:hypothetical protein